MCQVLLSYLTNAHTTARACNLSKQFCGNYFTVITTTKDSVACTILCTVLSMQYNRCRRVLVPHREWCSELNCFLSPPKTTIPLYTVVGCLNESTW